MYVDGGKFLTFLIDQEIYGIPIKKAREIIGLMEITHIPKTKNYIKGVINLRGKIIPIIDLRLKFSMPEKPYTDRTCVIVIETGVQESRHLVGVAVDTVAEVVNIQKGEIEPPPKYETQIEDDFLAGIGKLKEKVVMILDIEQVLNREDLTYIKQELNQNNQTDLADAH
jgi:Chemotaxis signal transduction protein